MCDHPGFAANVEVARIQKEENGPVVAFKASITVNCHVCGRPFRFLGLPTGDNSAVPMVSVNATELRAPIAPVDEETDTKLLGYEIRMRGAH